MTRPTATPFVTGAPAPAAEPSQEDRMLAAVSYIGHFVGFWLVVPIVVYVLRREKSRFVAFHAMQAIIVHVLLVPLIIAGYVIGLVGTIALSVATEQHRHTHRGMSFLLLLPYLVGLLVPWGIHAVLAVFCSVRAMQGRTARFPIAGWLTDRFLAGDKGIPGA